MKITPEQAQQIIDMVSPSCKWKERLLDLWAKNIVLKQEIDVDDSLYKEGCKDASESQKKVLDGIFGKKFGIDLYQKEGIKRLDVFRVDGNIDNSLVAIHAKDKIWLNPKGFKWTLDKNILTITAE